jgi:hypothetical protein
LVVCFKAFGAWRARQHHLAAGAVAGMLIQVHCHWRI